MVVVLSDKWDIGVEEFSMAFLCYRGVDTKLVPEGWVRNEEPLQVDSVGAGQLGEEAG